MLHFNCPRLFPATLKSERGENVNSPSALFDCLAHLRQQERERNKNVSVQRRTLQPQHVCFEQGTPNPHCVTCSMRRDLMIQ